MTEKRLTIWRCPHKDCPGRDQIEVDQSNCHFRGAHAEPVGMEPVEVVPVNEHPQVGGGAAELVEWAEAQRDANDHRMLTASTADARRVYEEHRDHFAAIVKALAPKQSHPAISQEQREELERIAGQVEGCDGYLGNKPDADFLRSLATEGGSS